MATPLTASTNLVPFVEPPLHILPIREPAMQADRIIDRTPKTEAARQRVAGIADCLRQASGRYTPAVVSQNVPWAGSVQPATDDLGRDCCSLLIELQVPLMAGPSLDGDIDAIRSRLETWLWTAREIAAANYRNSL